MSHAIQRTVKLPTVVAIGFSGHRKLPDESKSREAIRSALLDWKAKVPVVYGVSSVAAGGDLLFAETCIALRLPVRIFLPSPKEQFRQDFDEPMWARVEKVLAAALTVEVTGVSQDSTERYYECGVETVQQSQVLIALWDGEPARGMGGTSDMVHFAKEQGRPVVWIHSATGSVQVLNENPEYMQHLVHDAELDFLNGLPDPSIAAPATTPKETASAWFTKIDENANRVAPQFRRLAAIPIFCTAAAAVLSGKSSSAGVSLIWLWAGTALGLMAGALPTVMRLTRRQIAWTRVRTAAEVCRSCLALWQTPALYDAVGPEVVPELAGTLTSLNFLKMSDRVARQTTLDEFKRLYRGDRVQHQFAYFSRHAAHAAAQVRRYKIVTWASVAVAAAFNFWLLLNVHGLNHWIAGRWKPVLALSAAALFQVATVAGSMLVVNDYERRQDRYRELHRMLTQWDKQLELAETWSITLRITSVVEKALLAELIEWRSHIRNRKLPQK